jgi:hypothetical protein
MNAEFEKQEPLFSRICPISSALLLGQLLFETCQDSHSLAILSQNTQKNLMILSGLFFESITEDRTRLNFINTGTQPQEYEAILAQSIQKYFSMSFLLSFF